MPNDNYTHYVQKQIHAKFVSRHHISRLEALINVDSQVPVCKVQLLVDV